SFAIRGAAPDRSADSGRVFGIDPIHVKRDVIAGGAAPGHAERFLHDGAHAALVDVAHGEDFDSGFADVFFFKVVDVADADEHAILRPHFGREIVDLAKLNGRKSHKRGERHAVHVAARRRVGRVHVGVSVDPEQPDFLVLAAVELGHARHRAHCNRVIAAEDERNLAGFERLQYQFGALGAGGGDFLEVFGIGRACFFLLGNGDGNVAGILDNVPDGFKARFQSGNANGGGTHVNPAAGLAKVKRNTDHANVARGDAAVGRAALWHSELSVVSSQLDQFALSKTY